ncbi:inactive tyrosine- kinase 7-like isoform X2 [Labeo rohita]|uniref:Inactive tyrosine-kinase 7-like isoform X2 n=1 Tax=Labeo rohita TaxID=84645 RepID=A0A498MKD3_LABRO|nr:inactive tyrosine- kinase 7-like isoform X2 [Labeo rohita]
MDGSPGTDTDRSSALRTRTTTRRTSDGLLAIFIMCLKACGALARLPSNTSLSSVLLCADLRIVDQRITGAQQEPDN